MEQDKKPNLDDPRVEKLKERTELFKFWAALVGFASQVLRVFF